MGWSAAVSGAARESRGAGRNGADATVECPNGNEAHLVFRDLTACWESEDRDSCGRHRAFVLAVASAAGGFLRFGVKGQQERSQRQAEEREQQRCEETPQALIVLES